MAILTLRPNGAGNQQNWNAEGGDYTRVDETSSDGDTTRLYSPTDNVVATFAMEDHTSESGTINSVTVYIYTRGLDPISNTVQLAVRTGGTDYFSSTQTYNNTSYHNELNVWTTNPNTSAAWTWSEIDALEAGMKRIGGGGQAVTQVWVEVDYNTASVEQEGFRWRTDDGSESAATWLASQDSNITRAESLNTRLRILLNTTGDLGAQKFILMYKKSTDGTYIPVPTSGTDAITLAASSQITASGENTTAQLTAPSGKSTSDFDAGRIQDDENPADSVTISSDGYTELEWSLVANAAAVDSGVYQFRVYKYLETLNATEITTGGTPSASIDNPPSEGADEGFDNSIDTKWGGYGGSAPWWLKYDLGSGVSAVVKQYKMTSANDDATRDPYDFKLQGSNDDSSWTDVDTQTAQTWSGRKVTNTYNCTGNNTAYRYYRLYISANSGAGGFYNMQLGELWLYEYNDPIAIDTYTVTPEWTIGSEAAAANSNFFMFFN